MKKLSVIIYVIMMCCCFSGCKSKEEKKPVEHSRNTTPKQTIQLDTSGSAPVQVNVEKALDASPTPLKLSQIASKIKYYPVGDVAYPVTQAIAVPDSGEAFITFNNPRIYFRRPNVPSKRYGYKGLSYTWNQNMNGLNLFYDKKTTQMYLALSGKHQYDKTNETPCIAELTTLDTLLTNTTHTLPERLTKKYPIYSPDDQLIGFSSAGYTTCYYENESGIPRGIQTYSMNGDIISRFLLNEDNKITREMGREDIPSFHTFYWNEAQDRMNFMVPFYNTVYQQQDEETIVPLYDLNFGEYDVFSEMPDEEDGVKNGKAWLRTFYENPKGLFLGLYKKGSYSLRNWIGHEDTFRTPLTHQVVYLKDKNKTYAIPSKFKGFINDLDGGVSFWPDGQIDNRLYMLRAVTELRETIDRSPTSPVKKELLDFLNNESVKDNAIVMIVIE